MHGNSFQKKLAILTNKGRPLLEVKALSHLVTFLLCKINLWTSVLDVLCRFMLRNLKGEHRCTAADPAFQTNHNRGQEV